MATCAPVEDRASAAGDAAGAGRGPGIGLGNLVGGGLAFLLATLTALHLYSSPGAWALAFPVLIGLSCLYTKQHYAIDVPAGAALGWAAFEVFRTVP
jgi:hypothetical protein